MTERASILRRALRAVRRLLRVVAFLVLAVLVLAIGAYLLRGPLFGRLIADRIARELGAALGGRYSVVRVEGSYFFDLAVVGLRTEEAPPGTLRRLDCGRAVVEYDLRRLIEGDLGAISSVLVSNAVVEVDLTREEEGAPGDGEVELPVRLPRIEVYGNFAVATAEGEVRVEGLSVNTVGTNRLGVRADRLHLPERFGPPAPFVGTVARTGPLAFELSAETPVAGITPSRVAYADGTLEARLLVGRSPAEARLAGGEARLTTGALDLADLPPWAIPEGDRPEAVLAVDVRVRSFEPLVIEARASADRLRWRDVDLRDARVEARYDDTGILVRSAHAAGHGVVLDARDVSVDLELPWVVGDVGEAKVQVADLRSFEPGLDRRLSLAVTARRAGTRGFAVEEARVEGEGILLEARGEIMPPDDPERWQESTVTATCAGSVRDFASGDYSFSGEMRLVGEVKGTIAAPDASVRVEGTGLSVRGRSVERATLVVRLAPPLLRVEDLRVEGESGTLRALGQVDLEARTLSEASYEIDVPDLEGFLRLFPGAPALEGSLSGRGSLAADAKGVSGTAEIAASGLVSRGEGLGGLSVKVRASGGSVTVDEAAASGPWGEASAKGFVRWDEEWARIDALAVRAAPVTAELNRPMRVVWNEAEVHMGPVDLSALGGRVQGTVSLLAGDRVEATLLGEKIDLALLDERFAGRAAVTVKVAGDVYEIDASAPSATYEGRAASVRVKARSGLDGTVVEKLLLDAGDKLRVEGTATLPWRLDGGALARVDTATPNLFLEARAQGLDAGGLRIGNATASVRGAGRDFTSRVQVRDVSVGDFVLRGETLAEVSASAGRLEATAVLARSELGEAEARVSAGRGFDWTRPDDVRAALEEARLDGEIELRVPDLSWLRRLVPALAELSGTADGAIAVRGPLSAPTIDGRLHFAGVEVKAEANVPRFTDGRGEIRFDGKTVRIERIEGELGYAPVGVSGTIGLGPEGPALDLAVTGRNALLVADPGLRVRADLDLAVSGAPDAPKVAGRVRITDALYSRASGSGGAKSAAAASEGGPLFRIRGAPLGSATFDVEVLADETIRARTPSIAGNISCDLRIRGTGEAPAPEGRVHFRDLLVEAKPAAPLKVDRGEIRFPPGEPFDPRIDVAAHTRLKGYELEVGVDGRLADPELRILSRPPLSQDDAILLLASGYTREELEGEGIERAAFSKLASFLGEKLVARFSGPRDPDERTFLDRFSFTVGKDVSRSGESTIEAEFEASERIFLRVERDRFDEYNGGVVWRFRFR